LQSSRFLRTQKKLLEMQTSNFEPKMQQLRPPYSECAPKITRKART
jgi:hypothetical protein